VVSLALNDIQGNILRGYGFPCATYLFLTVPDGNSGRRFLGEIVGEVTHAAPWDETPPTTTNVALTHAGLCALGVAETVLRELPGAFSEPIRERARRVLGDTDASAPEGWDEGLGTGRAHILVMVNGSEGNEQPFADAVASVIGRAERHGLQVAHRDDGSALDNQREHFGWADGFGQPSIEGAPVEPRPGQGVPQTDGITWRDLKAGEFVLGYPDEDGHVVEGPSAPLLRNGTYMVYRKLYQDVARFRRELRAEAARYGETVGLQASLDGDQLYELMAAKVVGRWRDGVAIELAPQRPEARSLDKTAESKPDNDFRYLDEDAPGLRCPVGAHIRRTNPRNTLGGDGQISKRHRIIRRGMPYGRPLDGEKDDGRPRGLIFVCFNADIERQFEVIQAQWCNDGNAFRLGDDKDYLLGDNRSNGKVTIQGDPPHFAKAQPLVVLTRGCEYLLMPGISALRDLAEGPRAVPAQRHESVPPGETVAVARIVQVVREEFERQYATVRSALRAQHAKAHGCVRAEFVVGSDVPRDLRYGLFARPGTYAAWIRFSSSAPRPVADTRRNNTHGIAIKVMGVAGEKILASERDEQTQDFLLANSQDFVCRNAADYVVLLPRVFGGQLWKFIFGTYPWKWRVREAMNIMLAVRKGVVNPLQTRYWSQTPYALGPHAVKYSVKPHGRRTDRKPVSESANYLEQAMARQLSTSGDASFDFMVQLRTDPQKMPVEDPTVRWRQAASPFRKVATIRIPPQDFTSKERKNFAESLSFTPWHSLPEHRPLGGINRVRGAVYEEISKLRHEKNDTPHREPTGHDEG
jgi:Dyp-type peroxidase family